MLKYKSFLKYCYTTLIMYCCGSKIALLKCKLGNVHTYVHAGGGFQLFPESPLCQVSCKGGDKYIYVGMLIHILMACI